MKENKRNYRETLVQRLRALKPRITLDAGTRAGVMTKALSNGLSSPVVSIDSNKQVFPYVQGKVDKNRIHFVACDFAHLPFKDSVFCGVVCDLVISTNREWKPFSIYTEFRRTLSARYTKLRARFMKRLKQLKNEIDRDGRIRWDWGANYLIEATK